MPAGPAGMHNTEGINVDLYIPRKWYARAAPTISRPDQQAADAPFAISFLFPPPLCSRKPLSLTPAPFFLSLLSSATNRLIEAKDKASVQINIGHVNADGVYTGEWTTLALCGFVRSMGEGDGCLDRLWTKCADEAKLSGTDI